MRTLVLSLIPLLVFGSTPEKEDARVAVGSVGKRVVEWAEAAESAGFTGVVLAAKDGKVVAAVGVGHADLEGKLPNTPATLFELASATKQFTAAAVVRLVDQKKLALDDPVAEHLPGIPADCAKITVRHLLQHTSGIPGENSSGGGDDLSVVLPLFLKGGPTSDPGTHWEYWNQGYALLTEVIARASGDAYTVYCKEQLFAPAKLRATCFTGDKAPRGKRVAIGRSRRGQPRSALEHPYGSYGFQYRGMGGVVTSAWDLWRWDRALHGDRVLSEAGREALFEPGLSDYALGWYVKQDPQGRLVQSHGGSVRGFVCDVRRWPEEDACLFVLCNSDAVPVRLVSKGLQELLFGDTPTLVKPPRVLEPKLQQALSGAYETEGAELVIEVDGVVTRASIHWSPPDGPVTRAVLGLDDKKRVVLYEWEEATRVELIRKGKRPVDGLRLSGREYRRATKQR